jgi:type II secretory pathway component PulJ
MVELLISAALFSVMAGSIYLLYTTMQSTMTYGELKADLQQNARIGLAQMTQELRMTGYDPSGVIPQLTPQPKAAIRAAAPECLSFVADVNGSGTARQITYYRDGTILRRQENLWNGTNDFSPGGAGAQPLAESVKSLTFTYYDDYNQALALETVPPTLPCPAVAGGTMQTQLTYLQMRQIRRVTITLQAEGPRPRKDSTEKYTLTSDVRIRNK